MTPIETDFPVARAPASATESHRIHRHPSASDTGTPCRCVPYAARTRCNAVPSRVSGARKSPGRTSSRRCLLVRSCRVGGGGGGSAVDSLGTVTIRALPTCPCGVEVAEAEGALAHTLTARPRGVGVETAPQEVLASAGRRASSTESIGQTVASTGPTALGAEAAGDDDEMPGLHIHVGELPEPPRHVVADQMTTVSSPPMVVTHAGQSGGSDQTVCRSPSAVSSASAVSKRRGGAVARRHSRRLPVHRGPHGCRQCVRRHLREARPGLGSSSSTRTGRPPHHVRALSVGHAGD